MKSSFKSVLLLAMILTFNACSSLNWYFKDSVPKPSGTISLQGIHSPVRIMRDDLGIPCIEAQNEDDLFFAAGYAMATDRLWQMYLMSMAAQGRLSELAGKSMLDMDIYLRTIDMRGILEESRKDLDERSLRSLESFSRGVTAYIRTHPNLPPEFRLTGFKPKEWTPDDSLLALCLFCFRLSSNASEELAFLEIAGKIGWDKAAWLFDTYPGEPVQTAEAGKLKTIDIRDLYPDGAAKEDVHAASISGMVNAASNNWAIMGTRTASGKSIIANDPHLFLSIPGPWMIMHLKCPTYEAAGVTLPGMPFIALGYNGNVAWGATMVMADSQDLFIEKIMKDRNNFRYLYKGEWKLVNDRTELFKIKGQRKPVKKTVLSTIHGPILNSNLTKILDTKLPAFDKYGIAFCGAKEGFVGAFKTFLDMGNVSNAAGMRSQILTIKGTYFNLVYGDADNIGWQISGAYPIRKKGMGFFPSPGWDGEYDWTGFIPMAELPHIENPAQGFVATANNRTVDETYPYRISNSWVSDERVSRIREVLGKTDKATLKSVMDLQFDRKSIFAGKLQGVLYSDGFKGELERAIDSLGDEKKIRNAKEALAFLNPDKFDGVLSPESASAAVYEAFLFSFDKNFIFDETGPYFPVLNRNYNQIVYRTDSPFWDNMKTDKTETRADVIAMTLSDAISLCESNMETDRSKWQWGKMHTYCFKNMASKSGITECLLGSYMNTKAFPAGGDWDTVNVSGYLMGKSFDSIVIPSMRFIVDFGLDEPACLVSVPGESGNPSSPHYSDMVPYFLKGKNHPLPFKEENIRKQYYDVLTIMPPEK
ncbi:MAG TPA: penicillin acylase family protein [Desulfomonilia bacterium]